MTVNSKPCSKCYEVKLFGEFHKHAHKAGGMRTQCKICVNSAGVARHYANPEKKITQGKVYRETYPEKVAASAKAYREANPEKTAASAKLRRLANLESYSATSKAWAMANIEKRAATAKAWTIANPERVAANNRAWHDANIDKRNAKTAQRRAKKLQATPVWASSLAIAVFYADAARLTKATGVSYHVDHIVPLQGKNVCGLHVENNLQVLTAHENMVKHNVHHH